jgi:hypothetical protein
MRTYDFTPLFRSTVGFDRWNDLFDAALRADDSTLGYPPYNIEKTGDDTYRIMTATSASRAKASPTSTAASRRALSSAASALPITSRSSVRRWPTASCKSTSSVSCPRR